MRQSALRLLLSTALGALAVVAFYEAAALHGHYALPALGLSNVPLTELVFYLWYAVWGGLAVLCFSIALFGSFASMLSSGLARCAQNPRECVLGAALLVFLGALLFRHSVLLDEPITDDELVYQLTARNLALGRFTSVPPLPVDFLRNQFVIVDAAHWHGKYPIGHSLLLAPFELLGRPDLVAPLLAVISIVLGYAVGSRFIGARQALVATALLACSPHFVWTHATLLSQTTSGLLVLLAVYASLREQEGGGARWLTVMGASLGLLVLTRPMPGGLVVLVVLAAKLRELLRARAEQPGRLTQMVLYALPAFSLFLGLLALVNEMQSGSPWTSGYVEVHGSYGALENIDGELANSVGAAFVRENAWLFGWPCSLLFLPFARIGHAPKLFWALIGTAIAYRMLLPKTVVSTTGPIYVTEIVPWLCMASAAGMAQLERLLEKIGCTQPRERIAALVLAAFAVAAVTFVPTELRAIHGGARSRVNVREQLADRDVSRALIFANDIVAPEEGATWAYFAPNPWPDLRDELLFLRLPAGPDGLRRAHELWRARFADRPAFVVEARDGSRILKPLDLAPR